MKVETAFVGARLVDSLPYSQGGTRAQAEALKDTGVDGVIGYLGAMSRARLGYILDAGLSFMPVTFAGEYTDGAVDEIEQLRALGIPAGCTAWLDLEGLKAWHTDPLVLIGLLEKWAHAIAAGGWMPGLYVGAPQPLTGKELYGLPFVRYWLGIGRCVDRTGDDAYPACGWCVRQDWHNHGVGMLWKDTGVCVDTNGVQCDHKGRLPVWVVGSGASVSRGPEPMAVIHPPVYPGDDDPDPAA